MKRTTALMIFLGLFSVLSLTGCSGGHAHTSTDPIPTPTPTPAQDEIVSIAGSNLHTIVMTKMGKLFVTGSNQRGTLGIGQSLSRLLIFQEQHLFLQDQPLYVERLKKAYVDNDQNPDLSSFIIGHFSVGEPLLLSAGDNGLGQEGWDTPSIIYAWQIQQSSYSTHVREITGSATFSLFIDTGGKLWATGQRHALGVNYNPYGSDQQTRSTADILTQWTPIQVVSGTPALPVFFKTTAAGPRHALFIDTEGHLWGAGDNRDCQLGLRCGIEQVIPEIRSIPISDAQGKAVRFVAVAVNGHSSIALDEYGGLWVTGRNRDNNLGVGATVLINQFTHLNIDDEHSIHIPFKSISMSDTASLAVSQTGIVYVVGKNKTVNEDFTRLGLPETVGITPGWTALHILNNQREEIHFRQGFTTATHSILLDQEGTLWVTGQNDQGQLGTGKTENLIGYQHLPDFL